MTQATPPKSASMLRWLWLSGGVLLLDQASKAWAVHTLSLHTLVPIMPLLSLTLAYNSGAAFSFLSEAAGWQRWFLSAVAVVVSGLLIHWLRRLQPGQSRYACGLALILGGALGNLGDRLVHGHVIDFIVLHYQHYYFPAFNLADSAITLGALLLVIDLFQQSSPSD